ncbi:MAG: DUF3365 domain-containing protein [Proteobacteria bacterium]|nr:DUF3365 domain-containing protein [Pseudomonadota bacterium]MBU1641521.1 DUF3365 domain-containing protein [Pseudomonadota bacterium]
MSIRVQFLFWVLVVCLVAIGGVGYTSLQFSKQAVFKEAVDKAALLGSYTEASLHYSRTQAVPMVKHLVGEERFYPEIMSGFVMARNVADRFTHTQPGYAIKNAAIDPLWPESKADQQELQVIADLKRDKSLKNTTGFMVKNGKEFFYEARPMVITEKCLGCHGDPKDASRDQIMIYGAENGYNWKVGDVTSAMFVYVPVSEALAIAKASAVKLVVMGTAYSLCALLLMAVFLGVKIVTPLKTLCKRTEEISLGKNLDTPITVKSNREIGELARSIDRLRLNIARLIKKKS